MTVALRLAQAGERVTVIEREPLPGGLAAGFRVGDLWLEKFYHHVFRSDRAIVGLIEELGLGDRLVWRRPETRVWLGGRGYRLDSAQAVLRFSPLPPVERVRLGAALAALKLLRDPKRLEGQTAAQWCRRWMGERAYQLVWRPALEGKFGAEAERVSAVWFWARIRDRTAQLGYLRGGFQQLYDRMAARVAQAGGELRFGCEVTRVERAGDGRLAVAAGGEAGIYDRVVSCLPTRLTCRLAPQLPQSYRERYDWGQAFGAHCLVLVLDAPLTGSYWIGINDPGYPFMVAVEHTAFANPADYGGRHVLYLGNYRAMDDPLFRRPAEELLDEAFPFLQRIAPHFERRSVLASWAFAAPYAQPIVTLDFAEHVPPFETPIEGLYVANMFQVYPHDRGQNYSIALAEELSQRLIRERAAQRGPSGDAARPRTRRAAA
jgi:protoporphyrinogen oxidase